MLPARYRRLVYRIGLAVSVLLVATGTIDIDAVERGVVVAGAALSAFTQFLALLNVPADE